MVDPPGFAAPLTLGELRQLRAALDSPPSGRRFVIHKVEDQVMGAWLDEQIAELQRGSDVQDSSAHAT